MAIDTETMGLDPHRDRLCVVQLSPGDGTADVVQIPAGASEAPNLTKLLADRGMLKIFHFARFDLGVLQHALGGHGDAGLLHQDRLPARPHLYRQHGLKDLVRELLGIELSKQQQSSDWGADALTDAQVAYAASDVLHLHALKDKARRHARARGPHRPGGGLLSLPARPGRLDLAGWAAEDIFAHS